jgi:hypothetical protein
MKQLFFALIAWVCLPASANEIRWDSNDSFKQEMTIAPGKVAEVCGALDPRLPVSWSFKSDQALGFNIHRHSDKEVIYATRSFLARELNGVHKSTFNHEWCWMWTNETATAAIVRVDLKR